MGAEVAVVQVRVGDLHGHARHLGPARHVGAGVVQDPLADVHQQPHAGGQRDDVAHHQFAALGVLPVQARLQPAGCARAHVHQGLVTHLELVFGQGAAQLHLGTAALAHQGVHPGLEEAVAALALFLGAVQRHVGFLDHLVRIHVLGRDHVNAHAGPDLHHLARQLVGRAQRLHDARGQVRRIRGFAHLGLRDHELVAAQACHGVAAAHQGFQALGDGQQQRVTHRMAQGVVDLLESVQVDIEHGLLLAALRTVQRQVYLLAEAQAVGQAGQRVVVGHVGDARLGPAAFVHVLYHADPLFHLAVCTYHGCAAHTHPAPAAVGDADADFQVGAVGRAGGLLAGLAQSGLVVGVDVLDPCALQAVLFVLPGQGLPSRHGADGPRGVVRPQHQRSGVGDGTVAAFAGGQALHAALLRLRAAAQCVVGTGDALVQRLQLLDAQHGCGGGGWQGGARRRGEVHAPRVVGQLPHGPQHLAREPACQQQCQQHGRATPGHHFAQWPYPACVEGLQRLTRHHHPAGCIAQGLEGEHHLAAFGRGGFEQPMRNAQALQPLPVRNLPADEAFLVA